MAVGTGTAILGSAIIGAATSGNKKSSGGGSRQPIQMSQPSNALDPEKFKFFAEQSEKKKKDDLMRFGEMSNLFS